MTTEEKFPDFSLSYLTKCINPKLMHKWNGEHHFFFVACKKCMVCKKSIAKQWAERILFEYTFYKGNSYFLTLTYSDEFLPDRLYKDHWIKFMKRYRKLLAKENKKIKFFACGEYGETTQRPHFHAIILGDFPKDLYLLDGYEKYSSNKINKLWKFGSNQIGSCSVKSIHYVTGYILKNTNKDGFRLMSKGMGERYAKENTAALKKSYTNSKLPLAKYLCDKIGITDEDINEKLNKNFIDFLEKYHLTKEEFIQKAENARCYREQLLNQKELNRERSKL